MLSIFEKISVSILIMDRSILVPWVPPPGTFEIPWGGDKIFVKFPRGGDKIFVKFPRGGDKIFARIPTPGDKILYYSIVKSHVLGDF